MYNSISFLPSLKRNMEQNMRFDTTLSHLDYMICKQEVMKNCFVLIIKKYTHNNNSYNKQTKIEKHIISQLIERAFTIAQHRS